jgi:hypothetical protein
VPEIAGRAGPKRVVIEAVVIRADGRREELGAVSDSGWGRISPRRWLANRRISKVNRRTAKEE